MFTGIKESLMIGICHCDASICTLLETILGNLSENP